MRVVWVKDGNIGHEKQVKVLLDKLSETTDLSVIEKTHRHSFLNTINNLINYITFGISSMFLSQAQLSNDHLKEAHQHVAQFLQMFHLIPNEQLSYYFI